MPVTLRFLFLLTMSIFVLVSCGSDNDDDKNEGTPPVVTAPENEEDGNRTIRYSAVVLEENCGFWTDCDFTIRSDFNRRPVLLTAKFVDNGWPTEEPAPEGEEDSIDEGECSFQVTLTESEADKLESLADKLRICQVENLPTADGGFDGLFMTATNGTESMVYKDKDRGQEEEGKINYLCAGRAGFYDYMKKLIVPRAPEECPEGYKRLFR